MFCLFETCFLIQVSRTKCQSSPYNCGTQLQVDTPRPTSSILPSYSQNCPGLSCLPTYQLPTITVDENKHNLTQQCNSQTHHSARPSQHPRTIASPNSEGTKVNARVLKDRSRTVEVSLVTVQIAPGGLNARKLVCPEALGFVSPDSFHAGRVGITGNGRRAEGWRVFVV